MNNQPLVDGRIPRWDELVEVRISARILTHLGTEQMTYQEFVELKRELEATPELFVLEAHEAMTGGD